MILHTLNIAPSTAVFDDCLKSIQAGDALVLMGDGVYASLPGTRACEQLQALDVEVFMLLADAALTGITEPAEGVGRISMDELVALTERFPRQLAWY